MYRDTHPKFSGPGATRRAVLLGAAALMARPALAADPPADLLGWGATRWGMTRDELARAIGPGLVRLPDPLHYDKLIVRETLAKDYGAPTERRAETDYSGSFPSFWIEATWRFPTTVVVLHLTDPKAEAFSRRRKTLIERYSPGPQTKTQ